MDSETLNEREIIMSIEIRCECGQPLKVDDDAVGQKYKCPLCARTIEVPHPLSDAPVETSTNGAGQLIEVLGRIAVQLENISNRLTKIESRLDR